MTQSQLTAGQKIGLQRKAKEADVAVEFDPVKYDAVRLYVRRGGSGDVRAVWDAFGDECSWVVGVAGNARRAHTFTLSPN